jgi:polyhydroxyalkanoate synthesis regulator phasin
MKKVIRLNENDIEKLVKKIIREGDDMTNEGGSRYMFFSNLQQIKRQCEYLLEFDENQIEEILENGHDWAQDHIAEAKNNLDQVFDFLMNEIKGDGDDHEMEMEPQMESYLQKHGDRVIHFDEFGFTELLPMNEDGGKGACANRGLSKPWLTPDGPKKRSVCVKNGSGNVVKVNFGDPNMRIKKSSPSHRKSFRARHRCETPGPKWKARYWSCKAW